MSTLKITHHAGFFSCCSVKLEQLIIFFNKHKKLPRKVDGSNLFSLYKKQLHKTKMYSKTNQDDITFNYFEHYDNIKNTFIYKKDIDYKNEYQFKSYSSLDYENISPFVKKYFSPSIKVNKIIQYIEQKYNLEDYNNLCVIFYRGNDKSTETNVSDYDLYIEKAKVIMRENENIRFLIQSDETEFIEKLISTFPNNSFYCKDEIRHMKKTLSTVDFVMRDTNHIFSFCFLAITIIMSKCKYIICGSGNCSIWIMLYRGHNNNVYQL
jgi:hypothetical protein